MLDMARRLGSGRLSEVLGDTALPSDLESRGTGMAFAAARLAEHMTPAQGQWADAFAEGVNAYIEAVETGELPPPSELAVACFKIGNTDSTTRL